MNCLLACLVSLYLKYKGLNYAETFFWKGRNLFCDLYKMCDYYEGRAIEGYYIKIKNTNIKVSFRNLLKIRTEINKALSK